MATIINIMDLLANTLVLIIEKENGMVVKHRCGILAEMLLEIANPPATQAAVSARAAE